MQRNTSYDKRSRVNLIIDTLVGSVNYYPVSTLSIYPLIDIIKLLVQQPLLFAFFDEQLKLIYCTMEDPQYSKTVRYKFENSYLERNLIHFNIACRDNEKSTPLASYRVAIFLQSFDNVPGSLQFDPPPKNILNQYIKLFSAIEKERDIAFALHTALKDIDDRSHRDLSHSNNPKCPAITIEHYNEMISRLRSVFDEALGELSESPLLHNVPGNPGEPLSYPNIFFTVQNATIHRKETNFNYTAQVLLSHKQNVQINEWCKTAPGRCSYSSCPSKQNKCPFKGPLEDSEKTFKEAIHNLEKPLGSSSRSISDSVYYSGSLEFTPRSIRQGIGHAGGSRDYSSKDMNSRDCIYAQFVDGSTKNLLIPIHIGGVPWIILNTFTSSDKDDANSSWKHNYHIYRTVTRSIATRLRTGVKQLYLDLVSSELECHYSHGMLTNIDLLNKQWELLATVYPYDRVEISEESDLCRSSTYKIKIKIKSKHANVGYYLQLHPNQWYHRQVDFAGITPEEVRVACSRALDRADAKQDEGNRLFFDQVEQQTHTIKNIMNNAVMSLINVVEDLSEIENTKYLDNLKHIKSLLEQFYLSLNTVPHSDKKMMNSVITVLNNVVKDFSKFKESKCMDELKYIKSLMLQLEITMEIALHSEKITPRRLSGIDDLESLLKWFEKLHYGRISLQLINSLPDGYKVQLPNVPSAFTILWNLIHNARKAALIECKDCNPPPVILSIAAATLNYVEFSIKNIGEMTKYEIQRLIGTQPATKEIALRGLAVIQRKTKELDWQIIKVVSSFDFTTISFHIPSR